MIRLPIWLIALRDQHPWTPWLLITRTVNIKVLELSDRTWKSGFLTLILLVRPELESTHDDLSEDLKQRSARFFPSSVIASKAAWAIYALSEPTSFLPYTIRAYLGDELRYRQEIPKLVMCLLKNMPVTRIRNQHKCHCQLCFSIWSRERDKHE